MIPPTAADLLAEHAKRTAHRCFPSRAAFYAGPVGAIVNEVDRRRRAKVASYRLADRLTRERLGIDSPPEIR